MAVAEAGPIHAPLTIRRAGQPERFRITCPPEFAHYPLYSRESLTEGSWTLVPHATGPVYEGPLTEVQRFFRRSRGEPAPGP